MATTTESTIAAQSHQQGIINLCEDSTTTTSHSTVNTTTRSREQSNDIQSKLQKMQHRMAEHYQSFLPLTRRLPEGQQTPQDPLGWCLQAINQLYNEAEQEQSAPPTEEPSLTGAGIPVSDCSQHVPILLLQRLLPDCIASLREEQEGILSSTSTANSRSMNRSQQATATSAKNERTASTQPVDKEPIESPLGVSITTIKYHSLAITLMEKMVAASLKRNSMVSLEDWLCLQFFSPEDGRRQPTYQDDGTGNQTMLLFLFKDEERATVGAMVYDICEYARLLVEHTQDVLDSATVLLKKKKDQWLNMAHLQDQQNSHLQYEEHATNNAGRSSKEGCQQSSSITGSSSSSSSSRDSKTSQESDSRKTHPLAVNFRPTHGKIDNEVKEKRRRHPQGGRVVTPKPSKNQEDTSSMRPSKNLPSESGQESLRAFPLFHLSQLLDRCEHWIVLTTQALDCLRPWQLGSEILEPEDLLFQLWRTAVVSLVHIPPRTQSEEDGEDSCLGRWEGVLWKMTNVVLTPSTLHESDNPTIADRVQQVCQGKTLNMLILRLVPMAPVLNAEYGPCHLWELVKHIMTSSKDDSDSGTQGSSTVPVSSTMVRELRYILQAALMKGLQTWRQRKVDHGYYERGADSERMKSAWGSLLTLAVPDENTTDPFDQLFCKEWNRLYHHG